MIIRGLFEEVVERLVERGGAIHPAQVRSGSAYTSWITVGHDHCTPFDAEILKKLIDDMLTEAEILTARAPAAPAPDAVTHRSRKGRRIQRK